MIIMTRFIIRCRLEVCQSAAPGERTDAPCTSNDTPHLNCYLISPGREQECRTVRVHMWEQRCRQIYNNWKMR